MKIGIDASRYGHAEATGVEWYSFYIINALVRLILDSDDHEVVLYCRPQTELPNIINEFVEKDPGRIKIKKLMAERFWTMRALSKEMKQNPPDVLFVPSHTLPRKLPKRSVIMIHDVAFKHFPRSYSFKQYHYLNWSTKFAVKHADKILVPSECTKKDLIELYKCNPDKIEVVMHGFEVQEHNEGDLLKVMRESRVFTHFNIKPTTNYFFYVGRLEAKKNLVRLIKAFAEFSKYHEDYKLVLAGSRGHGFKAILNMANDLNVMDKVVMPGYITEIEKAAFYTYCNGFVFPSLYEGFGLTILDAFYYRKPVLCSNIASLPEVAGDAACFVDAFDVDSIKNGLEKIVDDDQYANELVLKGSKRLKSFSWDEAAQKTLTAIYG